MMVSEKALTDLQNQLEGEVYWDEKYKAIYATDASVYRKIPIAVVHPKNEKDIITLVRFVKQNKSNIIPRTAGTSLAGQCVGEGIIMDTSKYLNKIIELNVDQKWVRIQPGVNRDMLNQYLKPHNLFFPPETATANRAMIGGMAGNNSCGANSIVYGTTRDYILELSGVLSDGTMHTFSAHPTSQKASHNDFVQSINNYYIQLLKDPEIKKEITNEFPKKNIHRRNTGYALDLVMNELERDTLDLTKLLCGSEGTLMMTTALKLKLVPLPPPQSVLVIPHFHSIHECMNAVVTIMKHKPYACELMDRIILKCTDGHEVYKSYKFFVDGDPTALLMVEFRTDTVTELNEKVELLLADLKNNSLGYSYPIVEALHHKKVWDLRKAGLGLMANMEGDKKLIECIEDTAVAIEDLPAYIKEFSDIMDTYGQTPLYYAHAGAGEIHLRPLLNMHDVGDKKLFREICEASARLVKKYKGSLSGEHGDGRLRGEFIPWMVGEKIYSLFKDTKSLWDPNHIFNPNKIVDAPPIDIDLRFDHEKEGIKVDTIFDFDSLGGFYHAAARCSGSADCRKQASIGGTMCPSFMATLNEKDSTRARANALREFYSDQSLSSIKDMHQVKEVLDLCLSCKGCHNECPSNVDMTVLKAEFMYQYQKIYGTSFRTKMIGSIDQLNQKLKYIPGLANWGQNLRLTKKIMGIHPDRSLPSLSAFTFQEWKKKFIPKSENNKQKIILFIDEFSNHYDAAIAVKTTKLLDELGFQIKFIDHVASGRAQFSKGLLDEAKALAKTNIDLFYPYIGEYKIVGIEPSAILSFRDEYPKLFRNELKSKAQKVSENTYTIEEFIYNEAEKGNIVPTDFDNTSREILIHGHCHQKALSKIDYTAYILDLPGNHKVTIIPSGCCGMAGSFGYEKEHYDLSMQIGNLVLFPSIKQAASHVIIAASGTSCRHQIKDGTHRLALHPVEILWQAIKNK